MLSTAKLAVHEGEQLGPADASPYESVVGVLSYVDTAGYILCSQQGMSVFAYAYYCLLECSQTYPEILKTHGQYRT